jgi:dimethylhistidine N-methyltransferase
MLTKSLTVLKQSDRGLHPDAADVIQGLTSNPKSLPPKYFYDERGSQLFEQICDLPEYYPTRTEAMILKGCAAEIADITGACELVELGSGSSTKTRFILDAYQSHKYLCKYIPIDVSESILKFSTEELRQRYPTLAIEGLIGTYEQALAQLAVTPLQSRMIFFLGSSIGNFTPQEFDLFLEQVSQTLNLGDYFLLGVDLQKPKSILEAAYNDSQGVTAAFNLNMLSHLNWRFEGNFDLDLFRHEAIYNSADAQIEMYLHCQQNHTISLKLLDLEISVRKGETILTEISRKFDLDHIGLQLDRQGLKPIKNWTDPKRWFGLILCQVK